MFKQMIVQSLNGFSVKDIPFLLLQLSVSAILAWIIRVYWKKGNPNPDESGFLRFLMPAQLVFTTLAVFSIQSPWMVILFGFISLIPVIGGSGFSLRSKTFYLICVFIAYGCGAANLVVTSFVTIFLILPCLHFYKAEK